MSWAACRVFGRLGGGAGWRLLDARKIRAVDLSRKARHKKYYDLKTLALPDWRASFWEFWGPHLASFGLN